MPNKPVAATRLRRQLQVEPGSTVRLEKRDPSMTFGWTKETARAKVTADLVRLADVQERLLAERKQRLLVVLQGIDAAGKDGTISHVLAAFNPRGAPVTYFGVPSTTELAHDYLWRVHAATPRPGEIAIFNRSHYEDVLIVRVHEARPQGDLVETLRADQRLRADALRGGHDDREVLPADRPGRAAGAPPGTLRRPDEALEGQHRRPRRAGALGRLHRGVRRRPHALLDQGGAWYVIPANRKWFRDLAVGEILLDVLDELEPAVPDPRRPARRASW